MNASSRAIRSVGTRQMLGHRGLHCSVVICNRTADLIVVPGLPVQATARPISRTYFLRHGRHFPPHLKALTILYSHRGYATETSTAGGGADMPPPGFNAEQAKSRCRRRNPKKRNPSNQHLIHPSPNRPQLRKRLGQYQVCQRLRRWKIAV